MLEPLSANVVACIAVGVCTLDEGVNQPLVVLSSIVLFVSGLSLAMAFRELAARKLFSGTARMMDSLMVLFKLYFGIILGTVIGVLLWGEVPPAQGELIPAWAVWPAVLMLSASLAVAF